MPVVCDYAWYNGGFDATKMYTSGDTLIGGLTYSKLMHETYTNPGTSCYFGYLREDTASRRIYFMDNLLSPEILLYDFSMQPGDTLTLDFINDTIYNKFPSGTYTLDSIGTVMIEAGQRQLFYLSNHSVFWCPPLIWIESVGHPGHLVYTHSGNFEGLGWCSDGFPRNFYQLLSCFEHDLQKVYFDSCSHANALSNWCYYYADSCNYWNICSSLEENTLITDFKIYPNPSGDEITLVIESMKQTAAVIEVFHITGQKITEKEITLFQGRNEIAWNPAGMASGSYTIAVKSESGSVFRKLIRID